MEENAMRSGQKDVKDFLINLFKGTSGSSKLQFDSVKGRKNGHLYELRNIVLTDCSFQKYDLQQNQDKSKIELNVCGFSMICKCNFSVIGPFFLNKKQSINLIMRVDKVNLYTVMLFSPVEFTVRDCDVVINSCIVSYDGENEKGGLKFLKKQVKGRIMKILKEMLSIDDLVRKKLIEIIDDQIRRNLVSFINFYLYPKRKTSTSTSPSPVQEYTVTKKVDNLKGRKAHVGEGQRSRKFKEVDKREEEEIEVEGEDDDEEIPKKKVDSDALRFKRLEEENEILRESLQLANQQIQNLEITKNEFKEQIIGLKKMFVRKEKENKSEKEFHKTLKLYFLNFYFVSLNISNIPVNDVLNCNNIELRKEFLEAEFKDELEMLSWMKEKFVH